MIYSCRMRRFGGLSAPPSMGSGRWEATTLTDVLAYLPGTGGSPISPGPFRVAGRNELLPSFRHVKARRLGVGAAGWPLAARAQQTAKLPSIKWTALENSREQVEI